MRILHLDPFSGISGDMTVGALIDAGAPVPDLIAALDSLATGASFEVERVKRRGIAASKFHVRGTDSKKHRHLPQILEIIDKSALTPAAKQNAASVFQKLGEAEAAVHGVPIEKVHFHEVGAVDSISDIAGACMALDLLEITEVHCSPINTGSGTVNTEHGVLPVPAPATARLLEGRPVYARGPLVELTTPTGAAIAATLATRFGALAPMRLMSTGYGAGDRDFVENANVLRVLMGEASGAIESNRVAVIAANIDDSTPEVLGYAMERLLEAGALDVTLSHRQMKKNRPGVLLEVIAKPEDKEKLSAIIFAETTTLGLRIHDAERRVQARRHIEVDLGYGKIRMKVGEGAPAPEFEDCKALARSTGKPLKRIMSDAAAVAVAHSNTQ
jgi:pyridinium-3,5-bisthiocarboxylic acid mononucleotide nickel chelatase